MNVSLFKQVEGSAEIWPTFASTASARPASRGFLETTPRATCADLAHLEEQRFVVVYVCGGATVEIVAALTLGRARAACTETCG